VGGVWARDIGLLVLRVLIGVIFLGHALQKLGWFEGGGYPTSISEQEQFLAVFGYSSTSFLAWLLTLTELGAGASLILGLLTPLGAAGVIGIMFQFVAGPQWNAGLFGDSQSGGFEFALGIMAAGFALALGGAGRIALDQWLFTRSVSRPLAIWIGLATTALGLIVGAIVLTAFGVGFAGTPPLAGP
jgi:putative oxidoreductase